MRRTLLRFAAADSVYGFVGLGKMGSGMVHNLAAAGHNLVIYDVNSSTTEALAATTLPEGSGSLTAAATPAEVMAMSTSGVVLSMVPNDKCLNDVVLGTDGLAAGASVAPASPMLHVSCSTVSPFTSRDLAETTASWCTHISAPVFARPDGIAARQAFFPISGGTEECRSEAARLLGATSSEIFDFGPDAGAANVVKLAGNYLIASSIQSISEALALAEKNGLDRVAVMKMLSSTIFDCLIYKGRCAQSVVGSRNQTCPHTVTPRLAGNWLSQATVSGSPSEITSQAALLWN